MGGGSLHGSVYSFEHVCFCTFIWGCGGGLLRIVAQLSFLDHLNDTLLGLYGGAAGAPVTTD